MEMNGHRFAEFCGDVVGDYKAALPNPSLAA
jgi:hypothetical protein